MLQNFSGISGIDLWTFQAIPTVHHSIQKDFMPNCNKMPQVVPSSCQNFSLSLSLNVNNIDSQMHGTGSNKPINIIFSVFFKLKN